MIPASPIAVAGRDHGAVDGPTPSGLTIEIAPARADLRRARLPALGLAALAHLLGGLAVSFLFVATRTPTLGGHSVAVTLVSAIGASGAPAGSASPLPATLDGLAQSLAAPDPSPRSSAAHEAPKASLSDLLGEPAQRQTQSAAPGANSAGSSGSGGSSQGPDPYAYASLGSTGAAQAASRSLRDQAARCWRREASSPAVTLRVTLDERGGLAGQPTVVTSPANGVAQGRPEAVSRAMAAVRDCAPYLIAAGRSNTPYDLEFR
jgi:hypothetical protein